MRYIGKSIKRKEDPAFLTGNATYINDISLPGMLYAGFVRSPYAHARIIKVNTEQAEADSRIVAIITGEEAASKTQPMPVYTYMVAKSVEKPIRHCLATDRVRYVGEAVAVIAATDMYSAADVIDSVKVEYEPLEVLIDPEKALEPGAIKLHDNLDSNVGMVITREGGDVVGAFKEADFVLKKRFSIHRHMGSPIETRGIIADYNKWSQELTVWCSTQIPHILGAHLADTLQIPQQNIHVIAPFVGGGFGHKLQFAPEYVAVCLLAMKIGRPVKWIEDRSESLKAWVHAREQISEIEVAVKNDGTLLGAKVKLITNGGGYLDDRVSGPTIGAAIWAVGPYKMKGFRADMKVVLTNKCPYGAYRGFGVQMGVLTIERCVDLIAHRLGMDPMDVRRKNLVTPDMLPHRNVIGMCFDSGNYPKALEMALEKAGYQQLREEQRRLRKQGRYIGIGLTIAVEAGGWNTYTAPMAVPFVRTLDFANLTLKMDISTGVILSIGDSSVGTGHHTTAAQVIAEELAIDIDKVKVIEGDTAISLYDSGTRASRFSGVVLPAAKLGAINLKEKIKKLGAFLLGASVEDVEYTGDKVIWMSEAGEQSISLKDIAHAAYAEIARLPVGMEAGLESRGSFVAPNIDTVGVTWPYMVHLAVVEVDVDTGFIKFLRYIVVDDCGTVVNPAIVESQIIGATAMCIGGSIYEELVYDEDGQLLTGSFVDYLVPTALEIPSIEVYHMETPAPQIPGGFKGMGEAPNVYAYGAIINAVADAIEHLGVEVTAMPLSPPNILKLLRGVRKKG